MWSRLILNRLVLNKSSKLYKEAYKSLCQIKDLKIKRWLKVMNIQQYDNTQSFSLFIMCRCTYIIECMLNVQLPLLQAYEVNI